MMNNRQKLFVYLFATMLALAPFGILGAGDRPGKFLHAAVEFFKPDQILDALQEKIIIPLPAREKTKFSGENSDSEFSPENMEIPEKNTDGERDIDFVGILKWILRFFTAFFGAIFSFFQAFSRLMGGS